MVRPYSAHGHSVRRLPITRRITTPRRRVEPLTKRGFHLLGLGLKGVLKFTAGVGLDFVRSMVVETDGAESQRRAFGLVNGCPIRRSVPGAYSRSSSLSPSEAAEEPPASSAVVTIKCEGSIPSTIRGAGQLRRSCWRAPDRTASPATSEADPDSHRLAHEDIVTLTDTEDGDAGIIVQRLVHDNSLNLHHRLSRTAAWAEDVERARTWAESPTAFGADNKENHPESADKDTSDQSKKGSTEGQAVLRKSVKESALERREARMVKRAMKKTAFVKKSLAAVQWRLAFQTYRDKWDSFLHDPSYRVRFLDDLPWPVLGTFSTFLGPEKQAQVCIFLRYLAGDGEEPVPLDDLRLVETIKATYDLWCPNWNVAARCQVDMDYSLAKDCFTYMKVILDQFYTEVQAQQVIQS